MIRLAGLLLGVVLVLGSAGQTSANEASLALTQSGVTRHFTASELLARTDAAEITVANDVSYGRAATYRAVPLLALLSALPGDARAERERKRKRESEAGTIARKTAQQRKNVRSRVKNVRSRAAKCLQIQ